jgi:SIR2-like domain
MTKPGTNDFEAGPDELLHRLLRPNDNDRPVVFFVGAALATQAVDRLDGGSRRVYGVADVNKVAELVNAELQTPVGEATITTTSSQRYQFAFWRLNSVGGPGAVRKVIKDAVYSALTLGHDGHQPSEAERARVADRDAERRTRAWELTDGARALGALVAEYPDRFGRRLLTTNYDPTLAVSIRAARGNVVQTVIHGDGDPGQAISPACHLVHIHGYWLGYDTLHTTIGLRHDGRPRLHAFLCELVRKNTIVVMGYGGWDDVFASAARTVAEEDSAEPDIVWAFYEQPGQRGGPQAARGRRTAKPVRLFLWR